LQFARNNGGYTGGYTGAGLGDGNTALSASLATSPGPRPTPTGGQPYANDPSNVAAMAAWDPAMHPGRRRPNQGVMRPTHQGAIGYDWNRYLQGGNIGQSAPGSRSPTGAMPVDNVSDYPWMQDTSTQWGGGPFGYLPIGYQPQAYNYYSQNMPGGHLAPWEEKYFQDTWTQNFDKDQPGFVNTGRLANNPNYGANLRG
jgi:hypothetical protein